MKRIGVLTGGGDTSALNPTIKGICLKAEELGYEVVGFIRGWAGVLDAGEYAVINSDMIAPDLGGTILKTSRTKLGKIESGYEQAVRNIKRLKIDGFIPIGGDDTLSVVGHLKGVRSVAITKTIDNDVGTNAPEGKVVSYDKIINYYTPGFATAAARVAEFTSMANGVRTTAYSHDRIMILEAMGMSAGWLGLASAYGHADLIIVPEYPLVMKELEEKVLERYERSKEVVIAVSEGAVGPDGKILHEDESNVDAFGHKKLGGVAEFVAQRLKDSLGDKLKTRNFNAVIPSYLWRCGAPSAVDRDNAIALGKKAVEDIDEGASDRMACLVRKGDKLVATSVPFDTLPKKPDGSLVPRKMDKRFFDPKKFCITKAGIKYFEPILGPMPDPRRPAVLDIQKIADA
ncbi:MAG: 6-phosphofructokinase [Planctomycetota bacterium]